MFSKEISSQYYSSLLIGTLVGCVAAKAVRLVSSKVYPKYQHALISSLFATTVGSMLNALSNTGKGKKVHECISARLKINSIDTSFLVITLLSSAWLTSKFGPRISKFPLSRAESTMYTITSTFGALVGYIAAFPEDE